MTNRISIPVDFRGFRRHISFVVAEAAGNSFPLLLVSTAPLLEAERPICFCVPRNIVGELEEELDTLPTENGRAADLHQEPYIGLTHLWSFLDQI